MNDSTGLLYRAALGDIEQLRYLALPAWEALDRQARQEGLEGLLYRHCAAAAIALPRSPGAGWQVVYRRIAQENFAALQRLGGLVAGMEAEGLEVLLLPGAALLPFYSDPGCRPMDDIDLLARPGEASRLREFLQRRGFSAVPRHPDLLVGQGLALDLHADLLNVSRIKARRLAGWMAPEEVWRDRRPAVVEGVSLATMGLEDMALYTAVHALRHSFRRFTWFLDLYLLLRSGIDWERLEDKAQRYNLRRPLAYGLRFLQEQVGLELPAAARKWTASISLRAGEGYLLRQAFRDRSRGEWGDVLWSFSIPRAGQRCRFLAETFFPQPKILLQVFPYLPSSLFPLAYGLRLAQLLLRGSRQLIGLISRS